MLELRLRTLNDVADVFIAVEAEMTHQGEWRTPCLADPKDGSLIDADRWAPWADRLHGWYSTGSPMIRGRGGVGTRQFQLLERWHRDTMRDAAAWAARGDADPIVLLSDVDEIPNPERLADGTLDRITAERWLVCEQRFHSTAFDLLHPQQPWMGTCITTLKRCAPQAQRNDRALAHDEGRLIHDGGWHLSWFGTDEERQRKLDTFSHAELRGVFKPEIGRRMRLHANGEPLKHLSHVEVCQLSWPEPLRSGEWIPPDGWWS